MPTRRREQVPAAARQQPAQQHQQQEEEMVTTSRRLLRLRGFGCGGSWCKPPVLSPDTAAANSRVSALATDMMERGWVTREEYQQLLHGDRLYSLHESEMEEQERQRRRRLRNKIGLRRKLWKQTQIGVVRRAHARRKAEKRNKVGGAAAAAADDLSKSGKVLTATSSAAAAAAVDKRKKKKQPPAERPPDVCRDPITLDDLGSWTWDFRASEAATPPVSCGATKSTKHGGGGGWKGKRFGVGGKGSRGCGGGGSGGGSGSGSGSGVSGGGSGSTSSAVVTYNVESLVLYLLESGDFQEPTTRRPFSLVQLADLDALAAKAGAKVKGSLVQSYHEGQEKYVERRERREMLVGADRCLGDIISEMLSTIEDNDESHEDAHIYLCTLFPQFAHIFSEMKEADEEFARQCLEQHIALLRGPPNRPTAKSLSSEQGDLLTACVDFLSEQGSAGGGGDDGGGEGDSSATPPLGDGETAHPSRSRDEDAAHGGGGGGDRRTVDEALASLLSEVAAATMVEGGSSTSSSSSSSSSSDEEEEEEEEEEEDACDLSLTSSVE